MLDTYRRVLDWAARDDFNTMISMIVLLTSMMISLMGIHSFLTF